MKLVSSLAIVAVAAVAAPLAALAHHAFAAEFDRNLPITITGAVTKVEWTNPHARFYVDQKNPETGEVINWDFELASPNGLMRRGWRRDSLKIGDVVTVVGSRAKNHPHVGNASTVTMADGKRLFAGSSGDSPDGRGE